MYTLFSPIFGDFWKLAAGGYRGFTLKGSYPPANEFWKLVLNWAQKGVHQGELMV